MLARWVRQTTSATEVRLSADAGDTTPEADP